MPARRDGRELDAPNDASSPSAPEATLAPTTRSGLIRQTLASPSTREDYSAPENGIDIPQGANREPVAQPPDYLHMILRANAELSVQFKRMSETYEKTLEAVTAEAALYRKELDQSRKEIQKLQQEITGLKALLTSLPPAAPSTLPSSQDSSLGRSWASVVTGSSAISPGTKNTTSAHTLPNIILNLRYASEDTKQKLADGATAKSTIQKALRDQDDTKAINVEGVKSTPGSAVRIFLNSEEDINTIREKPEWLESLSGAKLKGEPWYPIMINNVRKSDVFTEEGQLKGDFVETFRRENEAGLKRIHWLSGPKAYGSMAAFLDRESDASRLLHKQIVQIRGEVSFTSEYHYRERPIRCHNCQQYGHRRSQCKRPKVCEKCAGNHGRQECTAQQEKCGTCGGEHQASDHQCPKWLEEVNRIRNRGQGQTSSRSSEHTHNS
jgi:hypothetical protein